METKELKEMLFYKRKNCYSVISDDVKTAAFDFAEGYKDFLNNSKTERRAVTTSIEIAKAKGFKELDPKATYKAGDKATLSHISNDLLPVMHEQMEQIRIAHREQMRLLSKMFVWFGSR